MSIVASGTADGAFDVTLPPRPYPGLRPFEKDEWPIFFGRERMADAVLEAIVRKQLLVVHGDSGCGKSSLVRAGILPRLEQESARGGIRWRTCSTAPGESPLWNLAHDVAELVSGRPDEDLAIEVRRVLNFGSSAPARLAELLGAGPDQQFCLLIDQFEELFDHARHHGPEEAALLTGFCTAHYKNQLPGLNVVLTMRSEFLGACARYDDFALTVNATQYLLPRMQHEDLVRAICEPARLFEGNISRALAEKLIADAGSGQDELPLIQHGLMLLHRKHVSGAAGPWRLGLEHYSGERALEGMLSDHADAVMADVGRTLRTFGASSHLVEDIFRALTEINPDGRAIRRPRTLRQLAVITGAEESAVRQVIDKFRAEGVSFLRPYGDEPITPDDRIDISHEALIRRWKKISDAKDGWLVREFRNGLIWRALLVQAESFEEDPSNVLSPATTDDREEWLQRRTAAWAERYSGGWDRVVRLITASAAARDAQRANDELARRREEQAKLRDQRFKFLVAGSAVMGVLLIAAIYFAIQARTEGARAREEAQQARIDFAAANSARARSEDLAAEAQKSAAELLTVVEKLRGGGGAAGTQVTRAAVQQIRAVAQTLQKTDTAVAASVVLAPRVYVHITDSAYTDAAREFERALEATAIDGANIVVPGIELVKTAPTRPALRCFQRAECDGEARKILDTANRLLREPMLELQDLSARYGSSSGIRPRHYEIWFNTRPVLRAAPAGR